MALSKKTKTADDISFIELKREISRLRIENAYLKRQVRLLYGSEKSKGSEEDISLILLKKQAESGYLFSKKYYFLYIFSLLKSTSLVKIFRSIINAIKKYTFITTSLKVFAWIFLLLQSSAVFVLSASAFIVSIPFIIFISYLVFFAAFIFDRKALKRLKTASKEKKIFLLFPPNGKAFKKDSFFSQMTKSITQDDNNIVIIISPYFFKSVGIWENKSPYFVMREEDKNLFIIRKHCYFIFKKKIFSDKQVDITEIY